VTGTDEPLYGTPQPPHVPLGPLSPPLHRASTAAQPDAATLREFGAGRRAGEFYQRVGHPNARAFESLVARREGADGAVAFGSGMAAMSAAILALVQAGDRVLVADEIYGGTDALARSDLPRFGVRVERFAALGAFDRAALAQALIGGARMVVFESPINPTLRLVDIAAVSAVCRAHGALSVFDGTFAPPPIQRALAHGVDLVVHSATKFYGGHSDLVAGVVAGRHELLRPLEAFRRRTGGILAPDPAWLLCRSAATMDLRVRSQQAAAGELAARLRELVARGELLGVSWPGFADHPDAAVRSRQMDGGGCLVAFECKGGLDGARAVFDGLRLVARAASLGGVETLASLPAFTTHASLSDDQRRRAGIPDGLLRISVGLEGADAIFADIAQAVRRAR